MPPFMMDPPSPSQNPLTIRTAKQQAQQIQQAPSSSSSQQPYPEYPIRIPPDKQPRALELYIKYKMEEMLAQNPTASDLDGYHLGVPGAPTARSVTSRGSSKRRGAPSTSASQCDGMTDYSSVVSFDQSPSSANNKEFLSYDGKKVKTRKRNKLTPTARAKAALVRYLGSCPPCRTRRVPCPLEEHHDIECLETLRQLQGPLPDPQRSPLSAASSSSQKTARSITTQGAASSSSVSDALIGIGTQLSDIGTDIGTDFDHTLDILSPGPGGNYGNTQTETPAPATLNYIAPNLPIVNPNPYATFQHGALFSIGCLRDGQFHCLHLQLCQQRFNTAEELQLHFERAHFAYTRIHPAHRYICARCKFVSVDSSELCLCGTYDFTEVWICGHFIKTPWYQRHAPDGTDFQGYRSGSSHFDPASYTGPNTSFPWDPTMNSGNFGGGGSNQSQFNYPGGSSYGRTGNQGYGWNASNGSGSGSNHFFGARQMASNGQYNLQVWCLKAQQEGRHLKLVVIFLLLLLAITFGYTHDWIITKARLAIPRAAASIRSHLPITGFVIIMASIALGLSIRHLSLHRVRRARCVSITIILDQLAKKHADEVLRDLDVLCTLLHTLVYRSNADRLDLNLLCVVTLAYDMKGGSPKDLILVPSTKHALRLPP